MSNHLVLDWSQIYQSASEFSVSMNSDVMLNNAMHLFSSRTYGYIDIVRTA